MALESKFQRDFIKDLERLFQGCIILKNDPNYLQGVPDLLMLWGPFWATFEVKRGRDEKTQPNQPYYVELMNEMSFSAFVYPENKEEVLREVQLAFRAGRQARVSKRKQAALE